MDTTTKELIAKGSVLIDASPSKVWDALTNPEQTKKYMFGCEPISDWKPGSTMLWKGVFNGQEMVAVKGNIKAIEKDKFLAYTTIDPNATYADIPENYVTVTYRLTPENGKTRLDVTQGDFAQAADGERRFNEVNSDGGWQALLEQIKGIVEKN
jgi:uncharacterized protein YndB with AHSA1/START domain